MATLAQDCVNYELNLQMCPCKSESCPNRGICCECIQAHYAKQGATACMRGVGREPGTMNLQARTQKTCPANQERNLEFCVCTWEPCEHKGVCCNCVRNHFSADGSGRTACMNFH